VPPAGSRVVRFGRVAERGVTAAVVGCEFGHRGV
jgi:hypothetical protein